VISLRGTIVKKTAYALLIVIFLIVGCSNSNHSSSSEDIDSDLATLGELMTLMQESTAPDSDNDGIPDDVENDVLGTDSHHPDSDRDGLSDCHELYQSVIFDPDDRIPDRDHDGVIAALDQDDDDDGIHDGENYDNDGDGIPNYLEMYGYIYDWMIDTCLPWDTYSLDQPYYKTDPNQRSSDQDPFDDLLEVSGLNMDVSIETPGDFPMVPATPDIFIRLLGCTVTLNQDIEYTYGESIEKGTSWSTTNEISNSITHEWHVEAGVEIMLGGEYKFGGTDSGFTAKGEVTTSVSGGYSNAATHSTTYSQTSESHEATTEEWSKAVTTNPSNAAYLKLFLKAYNYGTAIASNIRPTLTIQIGGRHVATLTPSTAITILEPGATYPQESGVYWVIDKDDSGDPIVLTLQDLQNFECGLPVSISVTQVEADVMKMDTESGDYVNVGDWSNYMARCRSVCADLFMETGDGNLVHRMIYADDSLSAPEITLWDAFHWGVNNMQDMYSDAILFDYYDAIGGQINTADISNWNFRIDAGTLELNNIDDLAALDSDFNIGSLRLNADSVIYAKAPRDPAIHGDGPTIYYAYHDHELQRVVACVTDYDGIESVECMIGDTDYSMERLYDGSMIFEYSYDGEPLTEEIFVRAVNRVDGETTVQAEDRHSLVLPPEAPEITMATANINNRLISVEVTSGLFDLEWVRAYYPDGGYDEMPLLETDESTIDVRKWSGVVFMPQQITLDNYDQIEIIAMSESGLSVNVNAEPISPQAYGHEYSEEFFGMYFDQDYFYLYVGLDVLDLDNPYGRTREYYSYSDWTVITVFEQLFPEWIAQWYYDNFYTDNEPYSENECMIYFDFSSIEIDPNNIGDDTVEARMRFNTDCKYAILKDAASEYTNISRYYIEENALLYGYDEPVEKGDVIIMKTTEGRCSKIIITQKEVLEEVIESEGEIRILIRYDYVTFKKDGDF